MSSIKVNIMDLIRDDLSKYDTILLCLTEINLLLRERLENHSFYDNNHNFQKFTTPEVLELFQKKKILIEDKSKIEFKYREMFEYSTPLDYDA